MCTSASQTWTTSHRNIDLIQWMLWFFWNFIILLQTVFLEQNYFLYLFRNSLSIAGAWILNYAYLVHLLFSCRWKRTCPEEDVYQMGEFSSPTSWCTSKWPVSWSDWWQEVDPPFGDPIRWKAGKWTLCVYQFQTFCQNGSCQFISCLLIGSTESIHQSHSLFPVLMRRWQHSFVHPAIMFYLLPKRKSQQLAFFVYIWHSGSYSIEKHLSLTACLEKSSNWGSHGKVLEYLNNTYPELLKSI